MERRACRNRSSSSGVRLRLLPLPRIQSAGTIIHPSRSNACSTASACRRALKPRCMNVASIASAIVWSIGFILVYPWLLKATAAFSEPRCRGRGLASRHPLPRTDVRDYRGRLRWSPRPTTPRLYVTNNVGCLGQPLRASVSEQRRLTWYRRANSHPNYRDLALDTSQHIRRCPGLKFHPAPPRFVVFRSGHPSRLPADIESATPWASRRCCHALNSFANV